MKTAVSNMDNMPVLAVVSVSKLLSRGNLYLAIFSKQYTSKYIYSNKKETYT